MIRTVSVFPKDPTIDSKGAALLADAKEFLNVKTIDAIRCVKRYYLEGVNKTDFETIVEKLLVERVWQDAVINSHRQARENQSSEQSEREGEAPYGFAGWRGRREPLSIEVAYKPGMMNPEMRSLKETVKALGIDSLRAADSSWVYYFLGPAVDPEEVNAIVQKLVMNPLIEDIQTEVPQTLIIEGVPGKIQHIPLGAMSDEELMKLSVHTLFLTLEEMKTIQNYFRTVDRDPTDGELETLAQTWSEHCGHKTFNAKLTIDGKQVEPLYKRLKEATKAINHPRVVSCFVDNAGVFKLNEKYGIAAKVETHNSPSALDPFGGAATGLGGVFRDVAGTGQGAKIIVSTDIFCVGPPDLSEEEVPEGCKHPRFILKGIVRGVSAYGNPIGIPTNNGSVHVHKDFRAKPSVIVGAYGLIELSRAQKGKPKPGDLILVMGGRTGRDGIHGATFSSAEMTEKTVMVNSAAVQIGDPIEEKRVFDAILELSEKGFIRAITDCGAGGFSSAIGEMGEETGVRVDLEKAPLKYVGLSPWEIWISESQERMVVAMEAHHLEQVIGILKKYGVEGTVLGEFTDTKMLDVRYRGESLCHLSMAFVHGGLSQLELEGTTEHLSFEEPSEEMLEKEDYTESLKAVLSHYNVASKEPIARRYDSNVQGTAVQTPYSGKTHSGPNNASVVEPIPGGGHGLIIGHGLNPILNRIDPYHGSKWAILEAVSNVVAQGADPDNIALVDNFIWPKPDKKYLADLSHSVDACVDTSKALGMPFISGKDSLSSTYRRGETVIHIPPVLCVSALGVIPDITKTIASPFKKTHDFIVLIGGTRPGGMGGSIFYGTMGFVGKQAPSIDTTTAKQIYKIIYNGIQEGWIRSAQDISEGGLIAMVSEMCFGDLLGAHLTILKKEKAHEFLFSESPARFVCEVSPDDFEKLKASSGDIPCERIGIIQEEPEIVVTQEEKIVIRSRTEDLMAVWKAPMSHLF